MPLAITLRVDASCAGRVAMMQAAIGTAPDYPPHITLAMVPDEGLVPAALAAAEALAVRPLLSVSLCAIGRFPGPAGALFLAPVPTAALLDIQAAAIAFLPASALHPHYRVGAWMPHVTLAKEIAQPAAALRALDLAALPMAGLLDRVDVVRFRPVTVLASRPLAGG